MAEGIRGRRRDRRARIGGDRRARRRRPAIDRLEGRPLLAVTSVFADGVLTVASDAGDAIVIGRSGENVVVNGDQVDGGVAAGAVAEIVVTGGPLGNLIDLSAVAASGFPSLGPVSISGVGGDNTIIGSALADRIEGGPGNDLIHGLGGDDTIIGGAGSDTIFGGAGDDLIFASAEAEVAPTLVGLEPGNVLRTFSADAPGTTLTTVPVTGLLLGGTIIGVDTRPATGELFALTNFGELYTLDPTTGVATFRSFLFADPSDATDPFVALDGTSFGVDFNPVPDRLRVTSDTGQNLRINVDTGETITDGPLAFAAGDLNAGAAPSIVASAYLNPVAGATATTLYNIDSNLDVLVTQAPPNAGTLNTVGPLGVDVTEVLAFDIAPGTNRGLATMVVAGATGLYEIDLQSGAATLVALVGDGATPIVGLAVLSDGGPVTAEENLIIWNPGDGSDTINGGPGTDAVQVNGAVGGDAFEIAPGAGGRLLVSRTNLTPFTLDVGSIEIVNVDGRLGDDTFVVANLDSVVGLQQVNLFGGEGDDAFAFAEQGASLLGGRIDGGAGSNTISYAGYTSGVEVNLDTGRRSFTADFGGDQEVPPNASPARGRGTFSLNPSGTELTFEVTYEGLQGQLLGSVGAHFHAPAPPGENAPIVRGLTPAELGGLTVPNGTFSGVWRSTDEEPLTPELVEQLIAGLVYFNIHTVEFPPGEIRGQVVLSGTEGTGPGLAGFSNIANVVGGSGDDTIIGGPLPGSFVGGPGSDQIIGGAGDAIIIWNPGDGSDTIEGGGGENTVQVNGGNAGETFVVTAGEAGRLLFRRDSPGPFSLDIGGVQNLELLAGGGDDTIVVDDLTGVEDLERIDLDGGAGDDAINASALPAGPVALTIRGGSGNDAILGSAGDDTIFGGSGSDTIVGGPGGDLIIAGESADDASFLAVRDDGTLLGFSAGDPSDVSETPITGLLEGEAIVGIDVRPATGALYALTRQGNLYIIDPSTGAASDRTPLVADPTDATSPFTALQGQFFGVDFNPVPDRLRVVSNAGQNLRINVETGATITDGTLAFAQADVNAGATPSVVAAAYTNSFAGATSTTLYDVDSALDALLTQIPPNSGTLNTVGGLGVAATGNIGFDILSGVTNTAFAALRVDDRTGLYRVMLSSGAASPLGEIGDGEAILVGLAAEPDDNLIIWNPGDGSDTIDGGGGRDTVQVNGGNASETFEASAIEDGRLLFRRTTPGPFSLDIGGVEVLELNGNGGDDSFVIGNLSTVEGLQRIEFDGGDGDDRLDGSALGAPIPIFADGGAGDDTLIGGPGDDTLDGGPGNNFIVGNAGDNTIRRGRINPADFDGDGITDFASYTFSEFEGDQGLFEVRLSTTGQTISQRLGGPDAFPVTGDFDGDGLADFAVYEFDSSAGLGRFTIIPSSGGETRTVEFGGPNDFPVAGDYDGDGITDIAVYGFSPDEGFSRFGVILSSTDQAFSRPFGGPNDFPVAGDYDGDGRTDIAVYGFSPDDGFSRFGILPSSLNDLTYSQGIGGFPVAFGGLQDSPVAGDYDGDGRTDIAVFGFSPQDDFSRFAILPSGGGPAQAIPFGGEFDQPIGGDYGGDGVTDLAVFGLDVSPGFASAVSRFLVRPFTGGETLTQPFGGRNSIGLPPSAGLFEIQPIVPPADGGGTTTGTAARRASRLVDLVIADWYDEGPDGPLA